MRLSGFGACLELVLCTKALEKKLFKKEKDYYKNRKRYKLKSKTLSKLERVLLYIKLINNKLHTIF